jgi:hypothetical protein
VLIRRKNRAGWPVSAKFLLISLLAREFAAETGSQLTASSATSRVSVNPGRFRLPFTRAKKALRERQAATQPCDA